MSAHQMIVTLYLLSGASGILALALMVPRRQSPGGRWFVAVAALETAEMFALALFYTYQHGNTVSAAGQVWLGVSVVCALLATPTITLAAYEYTVPGGRASRGLLAAFAVAPVLIITLALTNGYHHLYWAGTEVVAGSAGIIRNIPGPGFYGALLHGGLHSVVSMVLIGQATLRSRGMVRKQGLGLLTAISLPIVAHVAVYIIGAPTPALSNPSLSNGFSLLLLATTIVRYQLLDLVPAGRAAFVERMPDGLVVVDALGTIADCNLAAERFLSGGEGQPVGRPFAQVAAGWVGLHEPGPAAVAGGSAVAASSPDGGHYLVSGWPLHSAEGEYIGYALLIRDVSEAYATAQRVGRAAESMRIWESELDFYESVLARQKSGR